MLIAFAAILGIAAAVMALSFLWAEHGLQTLLWHDLPDALGVDPHPWFALAITTLGGLTGSASRSSSCLRSSSSAIPSRGGARQGLRSWSQEPSFSHEELRLAEEPQRRRRRDR